MHRAFLDRPVAPEVVDRLLARAATAPSAGHSQGWDWLVLEGQEQTARFWRVDADPAWLAAPDHPGLLAAPVLLVPFADASAYHRRYAAPDKSSGRLRGGPETWTVPYWLTDTAFATMLVLLGVVEEGLGALFFALHGPAAALHAEFGVPDDRLALGALAIGWPDPSGPIGSSARRRPRRPLGEQTHRGRW
jgi:nitroreductase